MCLSKNSFRQFQKASSDQGKKVYPKAQINVQPCTNAVRTNVYYVKSRKFWKKEENEKLENHYKAYLA